MVSEPATPEELPRPPPWFGRAEALPVALAALAGTITLDGRFVSLDRLPLLEHPVVQGTASLASAFDPALAANAEQSFSPLLTLVWRALWLVGHGSPLPYRIATVALHVAATILVVRGARRLGGVPFVQLGTGLLFAVHPLHATVLGSIGGQGALLGGVFGLIALQRSVSLRNTREGVAVASCLLLGVLAAPSAAPWAIATAVLLVTRPRTHLITPSVGSLAGRGRMAPSANAQKCAGISSVRGRAIRPRRAARPSVGGYEMRSSVRSRARLGTACAAVLIAVGGLSSAAHSASMAQTDGTRLLDRAEGPTAALLGLAIMGRGATLLVAPRDLAPFDGYGALDLSPATLVPLAAPATLSLLAFVGLLAVSMRRDQPRAAAAIALALGTLLLASGWLGPSPRLLDHGALYPATLVASWALPAALARLTSLRRARVALFLGTAFLFAALSVHAQRPFHDDAALWEHAVAVQPRVLAHQRERARVAFEAGRPLEGVWHLALVIHLERHFPRSASWDVLDTLHAFPVHAKIVGLPAMLAPDDTCAFIGALADRMEEVAPRNRRFLLALWALRYPECRELNSP